MTDGNANSHDAAEERDYGEGHRVEGEGSGDAFEQTVAAAAALFSGVIAAYPGGTFCHSPALPQLRSIKSLLDTRQQGTGQKVMEQLIGLQIFSEI